MKTNLKLIATLAILSMTVSVNSQTQKDTLSKKIKLTPKVGLTIANHKEKSEVGTSDSKRKAVLGFMAGVGLNKSIHPHLSIESGLYLAQNGSKSAENGFNDGEEFYSYSDVLKMLYIDVPLLARYTLFEADEGGLAFYGGVQPSLLLNAKLKSKNPGNETTETVTKNFKKFDVAATFGVGYLFTNGISIHARYDHGLTDINVDSTPNGSNYFKTYNRVFKFSVGYQLGKKNKSKNR
jgi:hypothetical protein